MTTRHPCPAAMCFWFHRPVATPFAADVDDDAPPWCLPNWAVVPSGYGRSLTAEQVVAAHVATHAAAERTGRMPSRAEIESAPANAVTLRTKEPAL